MIPTPEKPLFLLDYDGTLAEIVENPMEAWPHPEALGVFEALLARHSAYIVTGRKVADIGALFPLEGLGVVGVHGIEKGSIGGGVESLLAPEAGAALQRVREHLPEHPELRVEDKGHAIALHYRQARNEEEVKAQLESWLRDLPQGLEPLHGKKVLELRPLGFGKGKAVRRLAEQHPDRTPVFIGDDTTDEDAFAALQDGVTIKVGPGETVAKHRLRDVPEVIAYLKRYL